MIPSVLSTQIKTAVCDFLRTTYPCSTSVFRQTINEFIERGEAFEGPFLSFDLPFRPGQSGRTFFDHLPLPFSAHLHQERAFERLRGEDPQPTIVATGTGSGKTEAFLYPILDHCRRQAGKPGVKAILIYPMNALATDQAGRIARAIYGAASLQGKVTAGLFIGGKDATPKGRMSDSGIITSRDMMREHPPDILLTNYKMLDLLMVRPRDSRIWKDNRPGALRFLVVDELHTYDGAQGTDLACLLRRLKARLNAPYVCPIGTSATLGSEDRENLELRDYASSIFDAKFDTDAIITEERLAAIEFLGDALIESVSVPTDLAAGGPLDPEGYDSLEAYVAGQYQEWFGKNVPVDIVCGDSWRSDLGRQLKRHASFHNILKIVGGASVCYGDVAESLASTPGLSQTANPDEKLRTLDSVLALMSFARQPEVKGPLLNMRLHVWMREMRRMVATVESNARLVWADDLKDENSLSHLPLVLCRQCGTAGWGARLRPNDDQVQPDIRPFYQSFFQRSKDLCLLFPEPAERWSDDKRHSTCNLCSECLTLNPQDSDVCGRCKNEENLIRVYRPDFISVKDGHAKASPNCPSCESRYGLSIVGSQAASLISVVVGRLFGSRYNDDKKLLAFSDSVQDASHRAGFFQARTFQFTVRSGLAQYAKQSGEGRTLQEVADGFVKWAKEGNDHFLGTYIAPSLCWRKDYTAPCDRDRLPTDADLPGLVRNRLHWEVINAFGVSARMGRSLERTLTAVAAPDSGLLREAISKLLLILRNEFEALKSLSEQSVAYFLSGLLYRLRVAGSTHHPALSKYIQGMGKPRLMSQDIVPYMKRFGGRARTPRFVTSGRSERFFSIRASQRHTWLVAWATKCILRGSVLPGDQDVYTPALRVLVQQGLLQSHDSGSWKVWSIPEHALRVTSDVTSFQCTKCSHAVCAPSQDELLWDGAPCQRFVCQGSYHGEGKDKDYYRTLYRSADIRRIVAREHTGLVGRDKREKLETRFANPRGSWDPNVISCTPTLELGVDIGNLSSLILCSVPPSRSNYVQRTGRAGRHDGNALTVTMACAQPHDLYFYADPQEMIAGGVDPPGTFLDAPDVLERQLAAYTMDRWVASGISVSAVPPNLGSVLAHLGKQDGKQFPFNWLQYAESIADKLILEFQELFADELSPESKEHLRKFLAPQEGESRSLLTQRMLKSLDAKQREKDRLKRREKNVIDQLSKLDKPLRDKNRTNRVNALKQDRAALRAHLRAIDKINVFSFLTDEGLLPNYAFPQSSVTLQSVIYGSAGGDDWHAETHPFVRPGVAAIRDLAPGNTFYADGRKVVINEIDLEEAPIEYWRICNECANSEPRETADQEVCPKCASKSWRESARVFPVVRLKQVGATTSERESQSYDEAEERKRASFELHMLVKYKSEDVGPRYSLSDNTLTFGFEYVRSACFREFNVGSKTESSEPTEIAGQEAHGQGFECCRDCGRVKLSDREFLHFSSCPSRFKEEDNCEEVFLYREFHSEAIRMHLPFELASADNSAMDSFVAGLHLGLKRRFRGRIDHLQVTTQCEPIPGTSFQKRSLFLYDTVPGGTGWLKNLMREPEDPMREHGIVEILKEAADTLKNCVCAQDESKDGCYRCLYAYRNSRRQDSISRKAALDIFSGILDRGIAPKLVDSQVDGERNSLLESHLEEAFIAVLKERVIGEHGGMFQRDMVGGKTGYAFSLGERSYTIELQVSLGEDEGVMAPSRADFVIRPCFEGGQPIVVFTDGFASHHNRVGLDSAQRMALLATRKFLVWSLAWDDLSKKTVAKSLDFVPIDGATRPATRHYFRHVKHYNVGGITEMDGQGSLEWLLAFLKRPNPDEWRKWAFVHALMNQSKSKAADAWKDELRELAPDFIGERFPTGSDVVLGYYRRTAPGEPSAVTVMMSIPKAGVRDGDTDAMHCLVHLDDSQELQEHSEFKRAWAGFLRVMHLYQFLPGAFASTSTGLSDGEYDPLDTPAQEDYGRYEESDFAD